MKGIPGRTPVDQSGMSQFIRETTATHIEKLETLHFEIDKKTKLGTTLCVAVFAVFLGAMNFVGKFSVEGVEILIWAMFVLVVFAGITWLRYRNRATKFYRNIADLSYCYKQQRDTMCLNLAMNYDKFYQEYLGDFNSDSFTNKFDHCEYAKTNYDEIVCDYTSEKKFHENNVILIIVVLSGTVLMALGSVFKMSGLL